MSGLSTRSPGVQRINFMGSDIVLQRLPHVCADLPLSNARQRRDTGRLA
jgi:hypothetical protein